MTANPDERYARARASLDGLSVGDAFGKRFFVSPDIVEHLIENRAVPAGDWRYGDVEAPVWLFTDDTAMALSIVSSLRQFGAIDQDWLAESFALRYHPFRGYGPAMHGYLAQLREGADWRSAAPALFDGRGS